MLQRLITLAVWGLVGWTLMLLLLRLLPVPLQAPAGTQALAPAAAAPASLTRLFGETVVAAAPSTAAVESDGRLRLLGVVAPRSAQLQNERGVALLTIDGGPPRAYRVGERVDGGLRLLTVERDSVGLGESGSVQLQLRLPPGPPPAATGSLPAAVSMQLAPPPPPPMQAAPQEAYERAAGDPAGPRRQPPEQMR